MPIASFCSHRPVAGSAHRLTERPTGPWLQLFDPDSKSAANSPVRIARPNIITHLCPCCSHGMPGMVPRKCCLRLVAFVIQRQFILDFFVRLARIFVKTFVSGAICRRIIVVLLTRLRERLFLVLFSPVSLFLFWICHIAPFALSFIVSTTEGALDV